MGPTQTSTNPPRILPLPLLHSIFLKPNLTLPITVDPCFHFTSNTAFSDVHPPYVITPHNTSPNHHAWTRRLLITSIQLTPLLLLHPSQLVIPALAILPISPATLTLMALSQLPSAFALSGTDAEIAAAGTLSTLVASAWAKYVARSHNTEVDIGMQLYLRLMEITTLTKINSASSLFRVEEGMELSALCHCGAGS